MDILIDDTHICQSENRKIGESNSDIVDFAGALTTVLSLISLDRYIDR